MTAIISKDGEYLFSLQGNAETIALNIPSDGFAVDEPPNSNMHYLDGWVDMPPQPSPNHTFDYTTKGWIDERSIELVKDHHWQKIKAQRDAFEFGGFEFDGGVYDSDLTSQNRIMGASAARIPQSWTLRDNSVVDLTSQQLNELYASLQAHIAQSHERGRIARELINNATTKEDIELIVF